MLGLFLFVHGFGAPRASRKDVFHSGMHDDLEGHVDGSCWRAASVPVEEQRSCGLMDKALPSSGVPPRVFSFCIPSCSALGVERAWEALLHQGLCGRFVVVFGERRLEMQVFFYVKLRICGACWTHFRHLAEGQTAETGLARI